MKQRIIGISPRLYIENDKCFYRLRQEYIDCFKSEDVSCILLTIPNLEQALPLCDGFLIPGGDDFDPKYYNELNTGLSLDIDERIDEVDIQVIQYATMHKIPLLGICRGIQAINCCFHFPFYQDITKANKSHTVKDHMHSVLRVNETPLSKLLPKEFMVNSFHHQAVCKVPDDFIITYMHEDIIEAIEHKTLPIYAFQWHPERLLSTPESQTIFSYFIKKVKEHNER